jgi:y4mF family transcriptional regulator
MNKNKLTQLAIFVKEKRKLIHITQIELADKAGVGLRFVRDMEQGKTSLRMDKVNDVLILFGAELAPKNMDRNKLINNE